jgi:Mlc titration factor MtfA (ptsG expression regulator)
MYPFIVILSIGLLAFVFFSGMRKKRKPVVAPAISPRKAHILLTKHVRFYRDLTREEQAAFRERAKAFLETVAVTPVGGVKLRLLDRIYIACATTIPVFRFPGWTYKNLNEVIIYPGNFSKDFRGVPEDQTVMGMVGDGAMNRTMVISIHALRTGFEQHGRGNTGIHEAVHLLDKSDGAVDGIPEALLPEELLQTWLEVMRREIEAIHAGDSDINPYGGTSEAEFFAVVSEYYFQRPVYMQEKHPELFALLDTIYRGQQSAAEQPQSAV